MPRKAPPLDVYIERFKSYTKIDSNGCWIWQSGFKGEYPRFYCKYDGYIAGHRFSAKYLKKVVRGPDNIICHTCDNPKCVNPDHLYVGTHKTNSQDIIIRRTRPFPLSDEQILFIRSNPQIINADFARMFKVNDGTISRIRNYHTWKHLIPPT